MILHLQHSKDKPSLREVQRRVVEQVLTSFREQLARRYLDNSVLELNEAAYLLGYEDGNFFIRAFRSALFQTMNLKAAHYPNPRCNSGEDIPNVTVKVAVTS